MRVAYGGERSCEFTLRKEQLRQTFIRERMRQLLALR